MPRFVLEIGTEELPPRFFPPALSQLREQGEAMVDRLRLSHGETKVYGTPRRLVLVVKDIAAQQAAAVREERGPSAKVAFDAQSQPTKAAEGFARRHKVSTQDLVVKQTDQGEYVFAMVHEPEAPAAEALASACPDLIAGLSFPKSMRWGTTSLRFGRPVRWVLALLDDQVVEFTLADLMSGRNARGHPVLADQMFPVSHAANYEGELERHFVIVDPTRRRAAIERQIAELAHPQQARVVDGGLLEDSICLVEWPTCALGTFDPAFLRLPRPVLVEEMKHVQSYFPLENELGELLPSFIAVRDGGSEHLPGIVQGWESVLRAKLIDAGYFYDQDLKTPLGERVEDLKGVVFQEKLGTMYEKMERVRKVAAAAAEQVGLSKSDRAALDRAALLCKADLTTEAVTDISTLQGVMGQEYALASGEPVEVADAIGEHYRPRFAGDDLPHTQLGRLLSVCDKLDTISALFAVGAIPTGSADPYGLRREATGVVNVALDLEPSVLIGPLVEVALSAVTTQVTLPKAPSEIAPEITSFFRQRLDTYLREERGLRYDLVDAVLSAGFDDVRVATARALAVHRMSSDPDFLPTVMAATRVANIVRGLEGGKVRPGLFRDPSEGALWSAYQGTLPTANSQIRAGDYVGLFTTLATLRDPIDRYFEDVLVMAEDEEIRENRLATVSAVNELFRRLTDFSLVVQA